MSKQASHLSRLLRLPTYIINGISYRLSGFLFTPRPRVVCFPVTFRCNSRCQMCNLWQTPNSTKELDLEKIKKVFSNPLFKRVEEVVLHGGEPTLRKDLSDIYKIVIQSLPKLKNITSSTNGLSPDLVKMRVNEILLISNPNGVALTFTVSIDGLKDSHEMIRGVRGGFDKAIRTLEVLKEHQVNYPIDVKIITVIQPQNVQDLEEMEHLANRYDVDIIFQPLMIDTYYHNSPSDPRLQFSGKEWLQYKAFIKNRLGQGSDTKSIYWKDFLEMAGGARRSVPCAYDRYVLSIYPTGEALPCSKESWILFGNVHDKPVDEIWFSEESKKIRKRMKKEVCPTCTFYCGAEYSLKKEFFTYFYYYLRSIFLSS